MRYTKRVIWRDYIIYRLGGAETAVSSWAHWVGWWLGCLWFCGWL